MRYLATLTWGVALSAIWTTETLSQDFDSQFPNLSTEELQNFQGTFQEVIQASPQAAAIVRGESPRIVGDNAEPVFIEDHPWQVALVRGYRNEPERSQFCGGSVLTAEWVLTAAHCVRNDNVLEDPSRVDVVVGTSQFFLGGQRMDVSEIHVHGAYTRPPPDSDFALLRLAQPLDLDGPLMVDAVQLPAADLTVTVETPAFVTGWGATIADGPGSLDLLGVEVPVVDSDSCSEAYGDSITANMFCAGRNGNDSCQGDSGGPLTVETSGNRVLVGVVSWGIGCGDVDFPGVYARVTEALPWIQATTGGVDQTGD